MRQKTTRVICNSQVHPEARPALILTDAALLEIDSDDAPVLTLTSAAITELDEAARPQSIPLTPLLVKRLTEFKTAREAREQAPKGELGKALLVEDSAALNLAWAFENAVRESGL